MIRKPRCLRSRTLDSTETIIEEPSDEEGKYFEDGEYKEVLMADQNNEPDGAGEHYESDDSDKTQFDSSLMKCRVCGATGHLSL